MCHLKGKEDANQSLWCYIHFYQIFGIHINLLFPAYKGWRPSPSIISLCITSQCCHFWCPNSCSITCPPPTTGTTATFQVMRSEHTWVLYVPRWEKLIFSAKKMRLLVQSVTNHYQLLHRFGVWKREPISKSITYLQDMRKQATSVFWARWCLNHTK